LPPLATAGATWQASVAIASYTITDSSTTQKNLQSKKNAKQLPYLKSEKADTLAHLKDKYQLRRYSSCSVQRGNIAQDV
jgi:hypothetical protein